MASLNKNPGTSTPVQHKVLVLQARKRGIDLDALRAMVGGSLRALSVQDCSNFILRVSGMPLPNPPGQAPRTHKRAREGITKMISADHIEQIERLGLQRFDDPDAFRSWLRKNFKVDDPRQLGTAARAGVVLRVLKDMLLRKEALT